MVDGEEIGQVTSAVHSPRLEKNIALALVQLPHDAIGTKGEMNMSGEMRTFEIVEKPFYDPKKALAAKG